MVAASLTTSRPRTDSQSVGREKKPSIRICDSPSSNSKVVTPSHVAVTDALFSAGSGGACHPALSSVGLSRHSRELPVAVTASIAIRATTVCLARRFQIAQVIVLLPDGEPCEVSGQGREVVAQGVAKQRQQDRCGYQVWPVMRSDDGRGRRGTDIRS